MIPSVASRAGGKAAVAARRAAVGLQHRSGHNSNNIVAQAPAPAPSPAPAPAAASIGASYRHHHHASVVGGLNGFDLIYSEIPSTTTSSSSSSLTSRQYHVLSTGRNDIPISFPKAETTTQGTASSSKSSSSSSKLVRVGNTHHFRWFSDGKTAAASEDTTTTTEGEQDEATASDESTDDSTNEVDEQAQKLQQLEEEVKSLKDQVLRSLAEQENIRNIARRDVDAAKQFSIKSFAKSLLEVADNLDRALEAATTGGGGGDTTNVESFLEGVQLTSTGLSKALQSNGVTVFCEEAGEPFDPTTMNALMEYPDPNSEPGTVGQVIKKGYMLNGRVLRPAEVGVIKK